VLRRETEKAIEAWIPAIVYTMFIFSVSSIRGLSLPFGTFRLFDKVAHMTEFAGLGLFLSVAFRGSLPKKRRGQAMLLVIAIGLLIGVSDELFQSTVPGRVVDFFDWIADALGILVGSVVARISAAVVAAEERSSA
jgi:VanZ family protein